MHARELINLDIYKNTTTRRTYTCTWSDKWMEWRGGMVPKSETNQRGTLESGE